MSQSKAKCCVPGCSNSGKSHGVLHGFPNYVKEPERFRSWLYAVGGDILSLSNEHIYKNRRVCHSHFENKYCLRNNRISAIAVPTLNLLGISTIPQFSFGETRPLRELQTSMIHPSTSKNDYNIFDDLPTTRQSGETDINIDQPVVLVADTADKENNSSFTGEIAPPLVFEEQEQHLTTIHHQLLASKTYQKSIKDSETLQPSTSQGHNIITQPQANKRPLSQEHDEAGPSERKLRNISANRKEKKKYSSGISGIKSVRRYLLTTKEKELFTELQKIKKKLQKCKNDSQVQKAKWKAATKICSNPHFIETMEHWSKPAKIFTILQFREHKKKGKGRRFTTEEKIIALSILKQSPKAYRFLRKIFILPAPLTLSRLLHKANLKPGINDNIFRQLKIKAAKMNDKEKLCILLFDEISVKAGLTYNEKKDMVKGFVTNGETTEKVFADHAQVFMIRGLMKNYKQAIAYTFSSGATKGAELAKQLKQVITQVQQAGLKIVATVCDQGSNNRQALNYLLGERRAECLRKGEEPKGNIIKINNEEIIPLFDPPHLLKGIRNNLLTKNLKYTVENITKTAKWEHLQLLFNESPGYKGLRLIPTLSEKHVVPNKISKMKVKHAAQVFSQKVASNMGYLAEKNILPAECKETADLLLFFDEIFDSVNGSFSKKGKHGKPLLGPIKPSSLHITKWKEGRKILNTMYFVNKNTGKKEAIPTLKNWVWTLEGFELLIEKLKNDHDITSVWGRHLNQDPLENFFGAIRSNGYRNTNPTVDLFESAFATLLINNLSSVHTPATNCENDYAAALHNFLIPEDNKVDSDLCHEVDFEDINTNLTPVSQKHDPKVMAPLVYVSGYIVKKTKGKIYKNCDKCKSFMESDNLYEYIKHRDYVGRGWLCNPSDKVIETVSNLQELADSIIRKNIERELLKEYIKTIAGIVLNFDYVQCSQHGLKLQEMIVNFTLKFLIRIYCKNINNILYGKKDIDDVTDAMQNNAKMYYNKHLKLK